MSESKDGGKSEGESKGKIDRKVESKSKGMIDSIGGSKSERGCPNWEMELSSYLNLRPVPLPRARDRVTRTDKVRVMHKDWDKNAPPTPTVLYPPTSCPNWEMELSSCLNLRPVPLPRARDRDTRTDKVRVTHKDWDKNAPPTPTVLYPPTSCPNWEMELSSCLNLRPVPLPRARDRVTRTDKVRVMHKDWDKNAPPTPTVLYPPTSCPNWEMELSSCLNLRPVPLPRARDRVTRTDKVRVMHKDWDKNTHHPLQQSFIHLPAAPTGTWNFHPVSTLGLSLCLGRGTGSRTRTRPVPLPRARDRVTRTDKVRVMHKDWDKNAPPTPTVLYPPTSCPNWEMELSSCLNLRPVPLARARDRVTHTDKVRVMHMDWDKNAPPTPTVLHPLTSCPNWDMELSSCLNLKPVPLPRARDRVTRTDKVRVMHKDWDKNAPPTPTVLYPPTSCPNWEMELSSCLNLRPVPLPRARDRVTHTDKVRVMHMDWDKNAPPTPTVLHPPTSCPNWDMELSSCLNLRPVPLPRARDKVTFTDKVRVMHKDWDKNAPPTPTVFYPPTSCPNWEMELSSCLNLRPVPLPRAKDRVTRTDKVRVMHKDWDKNTHHPLQQSFIHLPAAPTGKWSFHPVSTLGLSLCLGRGTRSLSRTRPVPLPRAKDRVTRTDKVRVMHKDWDKNAPPTPTVFYPPTSCPNWEMELSSCLNLRPVPLPRAKDRVTRTDKGEGQGHAHGQGQGHAQGLGQEHTPPTPTVLYPPASCPNWEMELSSCLNLRPVPLARARDRVTRTDKVRVMHKDWDKNAPPTPTVLYPPTSCPNWEMELSSCLNLRPVPLARARDRVTHTDKVRVMHMDWDKNAPPTPTVLHPPTSCPNWDMELSSCLNLKPVPLPRARDRVTRTDKVRVMHKDWDKNAPPTPTVLYPPTSCPNWEMELSSCLNLRPVPLPRARDRVTHTDKVRVMHMDWDKNAPPTPTVLHPPTSCPNWDMELSSCLNLKPVPLPRARDRVTRTDKVRVMHKDWDKNAPPTPTVLYPPTSCPNWEMELSSCLNLRPVPLPRARDRVTHTDKVRVMHMDWDKNAPPTPTVLHPPTSCPNWDMELSSCLNLKPVPLPRARDRVTRTDKVRVMHKDWDKNAPPTPTVLYPPTSCPNWEMELSSCLNLRPVPLPRARDKVTFTDKVRVMHKDWDKNAPPTPTVFIHLPAAPTGKWSFRPVSTSGLSLCLGRRTGSRARTSCPNWEMELSSCLNLRPVPLPRARDRVTRTDKVRVMHKDWDKNAPPTPTVLYPPTSCPNWEMELSSCLNLRPVPLPRARDRVTLTDKVRVMHKDWDKNAPPTPTVFYPPTSCPNWVMELSSCLNLRPVPLPRVRDRVTRTDKVRVMHKDWDKNAPPTPTVLYPPTSCPNWEMELSSCLNLRPVPLARARDRVTHTDKVRVMHMDWDKNAPPAPTVLHPPTSCPNWDMELSSCLNLKPVPLPRARDRVTRTDKVRVMHKDWDKNAPPTPTVLYPPTSCPNWEMELSSCLNLRPVPLPRARDRVTRTDKVRVMHKDWDKNAPPTPTVFYPPTSCPDWEMELSSCLNLRPVPLPRARDRVTRTDKVRVMHKDWDKNAPPTPTVFYPPTSCPNWDMELSSCLNLKPVPLPRARDRVTRTDKVRVMHKDWDKNTHHPLQQSFIHLPAAPTGKWSCHPVSTLGLSLCLGRGTGSRTRTRHGKGSDLQQCVVAPHLSLGGVARTPGMAEAQTYSSAVLRPISLSEEWREPLVMAGAIR
eukprot:gene21263-28183_t